MDAFVLQEEFLITRGVIRVRFERPVEVQTALHGIGAVGEHSRAGPGEQSGSEGGVAGARDDKRQVEDVADDPAPKLAPRPAADEDQPLHRKFQFADEPVAVEQRKRHAFKQCAHQVALGRGDGYSRETRPQIGVPVRRTLALQIGVEEDSVGAERRLDRNFVHHGVGADALPRRRVLFRLAAEVAEPPLAQCRRVGRGDGVPHAWDHVPVGQRARVRMRRIGHRIDVACRCEFHDAVAGVDGSRAVVLDRRVAGAADDRSSGRDAGVARRSFGDAPRGRGRLDELRQRRIRYSRERKELLRPTLLLHVEKERALRLDPVGHGDAGEPKAHVVLDEEDVLRLFEDLRFVAFEPHHLRQRPRRRRHLISRFVDRLFAAFAEFGALPRAPLVGPHDRPPDGVHRIVEQHRVVGRAVERERGDALQVQALSCKVLQRLAHRGVPVGGVLLRPAGVLVIRRVLDRVLGGDGSVEVYRRHLAAARPEVDPEQNVFLLRHAHFAQACAGSRLEISPRLTLPAIVQR